MKTKRLNFVLIALIFFVITGCLNRIENEEHKIIVQKRVGEENTYEDFKEVTDDAMVKKAKQILNDVDWKKAKVDMVRPADYRFGFQFKNPEIEAKAVLYELWISPNKDKVELVIHAESKYTQLNTKDSAVLFEVITGEDLTGLK